MAIKEIKNTWQESGKTCEFILDSIADVAHLPKACTGSVAIVAVKDAPMYIVNASGEWIEL